MFDFAWSELGLIAVVAMIFIGPKDMPVAIRAVSGWVKKARRMAAEFQTHVDEMVREADLSELRASVNEIRNFDVKGAIVGAVDADGTIRSTFASNPLEPTPAPATSVAEVAVSEAPPVAVVDEPAPEPEPEPIIAPPGVPQAPAFVPPNLVRSAGVSGDGQAEPPAFIPPDIARRPRARPTA
jgi:sec-independent protein translocase protein TatB